MVDFIIEKDGKVTGVRVAKGVSPELDAEAVKVVSASPKWKPGRVAGEKVRVSMLKKIKPISRTLGRNIVLLDLKVQCAKFEPNRTMFS